MNNPNNKNSKKDQKINKNNNLNNKKNKSYLKDSTNSINLNEDFEDEILQSILEQSKIEK